MKRVFSVLRGGNPQRSHGEGYLRKVDLSRLNRFPESMRHKMIENYTKIITVRHPLDRLRSAYYNKFVQIHFVSNKSYQSGIDAYRANKSDTSKDMHFDEFVKFITNNNKYNSHWNTYNSLCHPCAIKFDFIIHLETMNTDFTLYKSLSIKYSYT